MLSEVLSPQVASNGRHGCELRILDKLRIHDPNEPDMLQRLHRDSDSDSDSESESTSTSKKKRARMKEDKC